MLNQVPEFTISDTKLYVPGVTLSTQDNAKLLEQLEPDFKRTINWNKYQFKTTQAQNQYLDYLMDLSFQEVKRLLFYHMNILNSEQVQAISSSNCKNKRWRRYKRWKISFLINQQKMI